jgi:hypothetical protein
MVGNFYVQFSSIKFNEKYVQRFLSCYVVTDGRTVSATLIGPLH